MKIKLTFETVVSSFFPFYVNSHPTEEKIRGFKELQDGWHYGEGVSFDDTILDDAISLNQEAINLAFFDTDAFPGLDGEIMLTIYWGEHYLEFTLEPNGCATFYREESDEEIYYQEGLPFREIKAKIGEFRKETWRESESLVESIMTAARAI